MRAWKEALKHMPLFEILKRRQRGGRSEFIFSRAKYKVVRPPTLLLLSAERKGEIEAKTETERRLEKEEAYEPPSSSIQTLIS